MTKYLHHPEAARLLGELIADERYICLGPMGQATLSVPHPTEVHWRRAVNQGGDVIRALGRPPVDDRERAETQHRLAVAMRDERGRELWGDRWPHMLARGRLYIAPADNGRFGPNAPGNGIVRVATPGRPGGAWRVNWRVTVDNGRRRTRSKWFSWGRRGSRYPDEHAALEAARAHRRAMIAEHYDGVALGGVHPLEDEHDG